MLSTTKISKVHPQERKADKLSDLNQWDMKFRPAGTMGIDLDVGEMPTLNALSRRKEYSGEENSNGLAKGPELNTRNGINPRTQPCRSR
eukprot:6290156-Heterocapsa_arctica.AAC.1